MNRAINRSPNRTALMLGVMALVNAGLVLLAVAPPQLSLTPRAPAAPADALPAAAPAAIPAQRAQRDAFTALQARATGPLYASWSPAAGVPDWVSPLDPTQRLPYSPSAAEVGNPLAIARGFLDQNRALFKIGDVDADLKMLRLEPDVQAGYAHVRMSQRYEGLPVYARQLVVHLDPNHEIVAVNGQFAPDINVPTEPTLSKADAETLAMADLRENQLSTIDAGRVKPELMAEQTTLMVHVDRNNAATLTWRVKINTHEPLGEWHIFVNARRPVVRYALDSGETIMQRRTYTARNTTNIPGRLLAEEGERPRDPVAAAAHDGAARVYDYFFKNFKRDSIDGNGSPLISTVNYGSSPEDAENAAWISDAFQMIYGDGGRMFKPLSYGLDVVGHEFTHGVINTTADLEYAAQSGALNESYADVFGVLIAGSNWTVGGDVIKSPPFPLPYLRSLSDPNARGSYDVRNPLGGVGQPASMREYARLPVRRNADNGGVHINSGIPNRAAYLVSQAIGNEKMQQVYYRALTQYLTPRSDFLQAANASVRAANDLYGQTEAEAVRQAFSQVGIGANVDTSPTQDSPSTTRPPKQSQPVPTRQIPAGCTELVKNGGFETDEAWRQVTKGGSGLIDPELPYTGQRSAWIGGQDQESPQIIYQELSIPANATQVLLDYVRLVHQEFSGVLGAFASDAHFTALFATDEGEAIGAVEELSAAEDGDDKWTQKRFDVSELAGKTVRLAFAAENPRRNISSMFIDDVSMVACTTGAAAPAPQPPAETLVYIDGVVIDADTNRGISGAQVYIMKPGVSASQAAADDRVTQDEVIAYAVTDAKGEYRSNAPIPRGRTYSVIIIARGYKAIVVDDGANVPSDATNPHEISAKMRRSR